MIQTRNMKRNNITMDDIQARYFHIKNYENIKKSIPLSWATLVNKDAKQNINYIFNYYNRDRYAFRGDNKITITRWGNEWVVPPSPPTRQPWNSRIAPIYLIIFRYENHRNRIKQDLRKICKCCSDTW